MKPPQNQGFLDLDAERIEAFATLCADQIALPVPASHRAALVENLLALQAHAKIVTVQIGASKPQAEPDPIP